MSLGVKDEQDGLYRYHHGRVLGAAAIIREVSARWEKDRALKLCLTALEAQCKP
jgi:hypothetical protein